MQNKSFKSCYVAKRTFKRPRNSSTQPGGTPWGAAAAGGEGPALRQFIYVFAARNAD